VLACVDIASALIQARTGINSALRRRVEQKSGFGRFFVGGSASHARSCYKRDAVPARCFVRRFSVRTWGGGATNSQSFSLARSGKANSQG
jgi:hypothetical protein